MNGGDPLLAVVDLTVHRGGVPAVDGANLQVEEGSFSVLVGASGCGKTSLLRAIAGFERPIAGTIRLGGEVLSGPDGWWPPERRQIGMVFQDGALFPHLTVRRNVEYGVEATPEGGERAARVLDLVGLAALADRYPDQLSGGERQRIALARALAPSPRLLLLDEPFASLDAGLRQRVREEVHAIIAQTGTTALLVTHDQEEALSLADRVAVMDAGRILQQGPPEEVYAMPTSLAVARFLSGGQLLRCSVVAGRASSVLGEARVAADDGASWMLVRPEQVLLVPAEPGVATGLVGERHFFGHDLIEVVELDSGERVEVRVAPGSDVAIGQRVGLALGPGPFAAFNDPEASATRREESI